MAPVIYYINYDGSSCSVYQSQIYNYCNAIWKRGLKIRLINCERTSKALGHRQEESFPVFALRKEGFDFIISRRLIREIRKIINSEAQQDVVIHCRGIFAGVLGLQVSKKLKDRQVKVITDIRGVCPEEYILRYSHSGVFIRVMARIAAFRIRQYENKVWRQSQYVFCVTEKLKEHLTERSGSRSSVMVVPTCIEKGKYRLNPEDRSLLRIKMGLKDKFVMVYSGGGQEYQNPEGMVSAFKYLSEIIENAYFLVLTGDREIYQGVFQRFSIESSSYSIMEVPQQQVAGILNAADCAVMLRENNLVNKVASPTKFAEYLSCGLPVLTSRGIGDIDAINSRFPVCIYEDQIEYFMKKFNEIKSSKDNFCLLIDQYYCLDNRIEAIMQVYGGNE